MSSCDLCLPVKGLKFRIKPGRCVQRHVQESIFFLEIKHSSVWNSIFSRGAKVINYKFFKILKRECTGNNQIINYRNKKKLSGWISIINNLFGIPDRPSVKWVPGTVLRSKAGRMTMAASPTEYRLVYKICSWHHKPNRIKCLKTDPLIFFPPNGKQVYHIGGWWFCHVIGAAVM